MNVRKLLQLVLLLLLLAGCTKRAPELEAVYSLIERVTPGYSDQFVLELIESHEGKDTFEICSEDNRIKLRGNNPVALATAYNQYLKYTCNAHVSWLGNHLDLPERLPLPRETVRQTINGKYRVYMNYCTLSYSAAWWDWERWQREIDYMAMNSVNMPLAAVGLEAVWYYTLLQHGFTDEEARTFLAGPAHFAWQWMQNLQSYGGPLPKSWIDKHIRLAQQIISREVELGMMPIQQGFSGYVPRELAEKYPDAGIRQQPSWCGFEGVAQLDPTDSLFQIIGRDFLEQQKRLYGAYGYYAADPFHESRPPVDTPEYLSSVGQSIHNLFQDFDSSAVWVMQAWSLREPIVKAVPKEDLLILDLNGGRSQQENAFWGYPFVAGNLHNFGGRINMHGDLKLLATNQYASAMAKSPNICGSGLFMESIEQNPLYYELAFEMPLHQGKVDLQDWLKKYAQRRYGLSCEHACRALLCLLDGPYRPGTNGTERSSIIAARPAVRVKKSGPNAGLGIPYSPWLVIQAQALMLEDCEQLKSSDSYRFDLVDIQRQMMTNLGQAIHQKAADAFLAKDSVAFALHSGRFLELLSDVDRLLRTRTEYNFDRWLTDARSWGDTDEEKNLFERNATALVTIWGGDGDPQIFDYSWREWSGLIGGYYLKRWEKFYGMLNDSLKAGRDYQEEGLPQVYGRETFRANAFYSDLADWELAFVATPNKARNPITEGDEVDLVAYLFPKYLKLAREYYGENQEADQIKEGNIFENFGVE